MQKRAGWVALAAAAALVGLAIGCAGTPAEFGSFERTLTVNGPARLEVKNGSGSIQTHAGEPGQVRIRAEVRVQAWPWEDTRRRVEELTRRPPIEQSGNTIRVGYESRRLRNTSVDYTLVVPPDTEFRAATGSGSIDVSAIHGPTNLSAGSGKIAATQMGDDTAASAGSGTIRLADVQGQVRFSIGSGSITLNKVRGEIRGSAGSGQIQIDQPSGRINVNAGSGTIEIRGAGSDLRVETGSGRITVEGNPAASSYWDLRTGSGSVDIKVPPSASFRLYARSRSANIDTSLPAVIEERGRRELRARIGDAAARVEVHSGSGRIRIY